MLDTRSRKEAKMAVRVVKKKIWEGFGRRLQNCYKYNGIIESSML